MSPTAARSAAKPKGGAVKSSTGVQASLGAADAELQAECPKCGFGTPLPIGADENGTVYKCFCCNYGYSVPADQASFNSELTGADIDLGKAELAAIARRHGIDPEDFGSHDELHAAMVAAGSKGSKAAASA